MWTADKWKDYELIDCGGGERLERWGAYRLVRPDPQAIWEKCEPDAFLNPDGHYERSASGGGAWQIKRLPESWRISYQNLSFNVRPMNFKHTGIFPEQAANWDFLSALIQNAARPVRVLNLFAYTGGATAAAAAAGASVCHVDAARGMVLWAKENLKASGLHDAPVRYIVEDCRRFVEREIRRKSRYDGIVMDPPSYGRGPSGQVWKLEDDLYPFVELALGALSEDPLFFIVNSYTAGLPPSAVGYILGRTVKRRFGGSVEWGELGLPVTKSALVFPAGITGRWVSGRGGV